MPLDRVGIKAVVEGFDAYVKQVAALEKGTDRFTASTVRAEKQAGASFERLLKTGIGLGVGLAGVQTATALVRGTFESTIGAAIDFEASFAQVRKTVEGTPEELDAIAASIRELAKTIPVSVIELNSIAASAGALGIAKEDILEFTETVAQLSVATNLTSEEAGVALARLGTITGTATGDLDNMASAIVDLGNNGASTEKEIVDLALRIAGAGTAAGLSAADVLGLSNALASLGINAEAGGTAMSRVIIEIAQEVATGGDRLEEFAATAGMTAQEFAAAWSEDPSRALQGFLEGLGEVQEAGGNLFQLLEDLGLDDIRVRDVLLRIAAANDEVAASLERSRAAWEENAALQEEFDRFAETTAAKWQILKNNLLDVGITLGTALLPALIDTANAGVTVAVALEPLAEILAELLQTLPAVVISAGAFAAVFAAIKLTQLIAETTSFLNLMIRTGATSEHVGKAVAAAFSSPLPALLALTAAVAALDFGLRALTGSGILDWLTGAAQANQRAAEFTERWGDAQERVNKLLEEGASLPQAEDITLRDLAANLENALGLMDELQRRRDELGPGLLAVPPGLREEFVEVSERIQETTDDVAGFEDEIRKIIPTQRQWNELTAEFPSLATRFNDEIAESAKNAAAVADEQDEGAQSAEDWAKEQEEASKRVQKAFKDLLPSVRQTFDEWLEELEQAAQAYETFQQNLDVINAVLVASNVAGVDQIMQVLREAGPVYTAQFTKMFAEDPAAALELLARIGPALVGLMAGDMAGTIAGAGPAVAGATQTGLVDPVLGTLASGVASAGALGTAYGQAFGAGLAGGMRGHVDEAGNRLVLPGGPAVTKSFDQVIADLIADLIAQASKLPSFNPTAGGGAGSNAIVSALEAFTDSTATSQMLDHLVSVFGEAGGEAVAALGAAIETGAEAEGQRLGDAVDRLIDEARERGVPNAEALGNELIQTVANALAAGTPDAQAAAEAAIGAMAAAIGFNAASEFAFAINAALAENALIAQVGEQGAAIVTALETAIRDGTPEAGRALSDAVDAMIDEAKDVPGAEELGSDLVAAVARAVREGTPEAVQAVLALVDKMNAALERGAGRMELTVASFIQGVNQAIANANIGAAAGDAGLRVVQGLVDALVNGRPEAIGAVQDTVGGIIFELHDNLAPATASALGTALMTALTAAIQSGSTEAINAVTAVLTTINTALANAAAAAVETAQTTVQAVSAATDNLDAEQRAMEQAVERARRHRIDEINRLGDAIMEALRRQYREQERAQLDSIDAQRDALEQWADEQIRIRQGPIQAELDAMDQLERDERRADLERRLALAYDAKERAEIQRQLDDLLRDERRQELQDQLRAIEDQVRDERQVKEDALDVEADRIRAHFERLTSEAALGAEARLLIEKGHQDEIIALIQSYYPEWNATGQSLGEQLVDGLNSSGIEETIGNILTLVRQTSQELAHLFYEPPDGGGSTGGGGPGGPGPTFNNGPKKPTQVPPIPGGGGADGAAGGQYIGVPNDAVVQGWNLVTTGALGPSLGADYGTNDVYIANPDGTLSKVGPQEAVPPNTAVWLYKYDRGTLFHPGGAALVHRDEVVNLPRGSQVIPDFSNLIRSAVMPLMTGGGGDTIIGPFDFRGAQFTGTPRDNEEMMRRVVRTELSTMSRRESRHWGINR